MKAAVLKETFPGERRVALVPATVPQLVKAGLEVLIQAGAGNAAGFLDADYSAKGATIASSRAEACAADILLQVRTLGANTVGGREDLGLFRPGQIVIGLADPLGEPQAAAELAKTGVTLFALELIPRITRAQAMDVLSSQATIAGYRNMLARQPEARTSGDRRRECDTKWSRRGGDRAFLMCCEPLGLFESSLQDRRGLLDLAPRSSFCRRQDVLDPCNVHRLAGPRELDRVFDHPAGAAVQRETDLVAEHLLHGFDAGYDVFEASFGHYAAVRVRRSLARLVVPHVGDGPHHPGVVEADGHLDQREAFFAFLHLLDVLGVVPRHLTSHRRPEASVVDADGVADLTA